MSGGYAEALEPLEKAAKLADRMDNRTLKGECAVLLAVAEGRLGRSTSQIDWARMALGAFARTEWSAGTIGAAYELGLGLATEGRYAEAQASVRPLSQWHPGSVPNWAIQGALLCEADVVAMCGNTRRAYSLARKATSKAMLQLLNASYAGQFARWVSLLGIRDADAAGARARLQVTFPITTHLHCKDQAEVLAAMATLDSRLGPVSTATWAQVRRRLASLPVAVTAMLTRLGTRVGPESGNPGSR
jgi:hypothetical protein